MINIKRNNYCLESYCLVLREINGKQNRLFPILPSVYPFCLNSKQNRRLK